jgi:hypothetical protein
MGLFGGGKKTTINKVELPAWMDAAGRKATERGSALADRGYTGYDSRKRVAGLHGNEQLASQRAASLSSRYQPFLDRAGTEFSSGALGKYMDPYREQVIDVGNRRINEDYGREMGALSRKRGMIDAFGGSRGTQLESALNSRRDRAIRENETLGLSSAFNQGRDAFFQDRASNMSAAQTIGALGGDEINLLGSTGANERQQSQMTKDFDYGQFLEKRDWDLNNLQPLLAAISGAAPAAGRTETSTTKTSGGGFGQVLGLAAAVGGAFLTGGVSLASLGSGLTAAAGAQK